MAQKRKAVEEGVHGHASAKTDTKTKDSVEQQTPHQQEDDHVGMNEEESAPRASRGWTKEPVYRVDIHTCGTFVCKTFFTK